MTTWAWDDESDSEGVGHYAEANTDYSNAAEIQQAYDYVDFSEITPNPVSAYPLHEDSGTTTYDLAGTNDGTINGATVGVTGLLGTSAYSFDGTDDDTSIGEIGLEGNDTFTITAWVNLDSTNTNTQTITINGSGSANDTLILGEASGAWRWRYNSGSSQVDGGTAGTGEWHFICGVFDNPNNNLELFENATSVATGGTSGSLNSTSAGFKIGGRSGDFCLDGRIADVRYYDVVLSSSQIQTLYDAVATQGDWLGTGKTL